MSNAISSFIGVVTKEFDRLNSRPLTPAEEHEQTREWNRWQAKKKEGEDDKTRNAIMRAYPYANPMEAEMDIEGPILQTMLSYCSTTEEWFQTAGIFAGPRSRIQLTAINGSARERLACFIEMQQDQAKKQEEQEEREGTGYRSKTLARIRKAQEAIKKAEAEKKANGQSTKFTSPEEAAATLELQEGLNALSTHDRHLELRNALRIAEIKRTELESRKDNLQLPDHPQIVRAWNDVVSEIARLKEELGKSEIEGSDQPQENSRAQLMRYIFETVMESSKVNLTRKVEIIERALATQPLLQQSKTRCQRIALKVQGLIEWILSNPISRLALMLAAVVYVIKIYSFAYILLKTQLIARILPQSTVYVINYAPAVITKTVNSIVGIVSLIFANQFPLLIFRVGTWRTRNRLLDRTANVLIAPTWLFINTFIVWPLELMKRSKNLSDRTRAFIVDRLNEISTQQRRTMELRNSKLAFDTWMRLTTPAQAQAGA